MKLSWLFIIGENVLRMGGWDDDFMPQHVPHATSFDYVCSPAWPRKGPTGGWAGLGAVRSALGCAMCARVEVSLSIALPLAGPSILSCIVHCAARARVQCRLGIAWASLSRWCDCVLGFARWGKVRGLFGVVSRVLSLWVAERVFWCDGAGVDVAESV